MEHLFERGNKFHQNIETVLVDCELSIGNPFVIMVNWISDQDRR